MQPCACSRHVNVIQKEKPEEKAGKRQPGSSLYWRGGLHQFWRLGWYRYHRMAAGIEHTLLWLGQTGKTKHLEGSPHQHLVRTATSSGRKTDLEGRSCCDHWLGPAALLSDTKGKASKAWDGQQWDRGCRLSPRTHPCFSACESLSPMATALLLVEVAVAVPQELCLPCAASLSPGSSHQSPLRALSGVVLRWHLAFPTPPFLCV